MKLVAIDIGGTKTAFAEIDVKHQRLMRTAKIPTPRDEQENGEAFLDQIMESLEREWISEAEAIGVSLCEIVDRNQQITSGHRVKWLGLPVRERLSRLRPATLEADVRAAALAEAAKGAGLSLDHFLYVNLGTGISSCWVENGKPWAGAHGAALVFANSPCEMRSFDGTLSTYVLEDVAGGEGLSAHYRERSGKHLAAHEIFARAGAGESLADEIVKQGASSLGMALGHAVGMLDPPAIIMGGGLASSGFYMKHIEDEMRRFIWHEASRGVPVLRASLGGEACLWGAALAAERTMS